jgi:hypothetical protein
MLKLPVPLRRFLQLSAALTVLCLATEAVCALILHWPAPYTWPLTPRPELFYDLNGFYPKFAYFHSSAFFSIEPQYGFAYPAPMAVLYKAVYSLLPVQELREQSLLALIAAVLALGGVILGLQLVRRGLSKWAAGGFCAALVLFSYPFWFEAKQGNLEFFVFLLIAAGVVLLLKGRGYSSAAAFALAGSLKIFPLVFLGLHIAQRRWRPLLLALALVPLITLASLWLLAPDVAFTWQHLQANLQEFQTKIVLHVVPREIGFDHSLFSVVKRVLGPNPALISGYMLLAALAGCVLFFVRIRHLPIVNQVLALTVASVLLPPVSYDYTLIHLYLPLFPLVMLALRSAQSAWNIPGLSAILPLLAATLAPLSELIYQGVRFGGQLRALLLLTLFILSLVFRLEEPCPQVCDKVS